MRAKLIMGSTLALSLMATASMAGTHVGWYVAADAGVHQTPTQKLTITNATLYSRDVTFTGSSSESSSSSSSSGQGAPALGATAQGAPDLSNDPIIDGTGANYSLRTKSGTIGAVRAGYQFTPHWRVEGEIAGRESTIKHSIVDGNDSETGASGRGHMLIHSIMANVLYDFTPDSKLHPFVGLGVGQATIKTSYKGELPASTTGEPYNLATTYKINAKKKNSAWQAIAGLSWSLSEHLNLDVTYRYLDAGRIGYNITTDSTYDVDEEYNDGCNESDACYPYPNTELKAANARAVSPRVNALTVDTYHVTETDILTTGPRRIHDQSITVGLRWAFGGSTPPPPPVVETAPPPVIPEAPPVSAPVVDGYGPQKAAPRAFTVYFNFDKSNLTDEARRVVNAAASYALSAPSPSLTVTGHTDTSGSQAYNVRLSEKRANSVAQGLTEAGVSASSIKLGWSGEGDLAVPTGDGVKNPENRRTTIDVAW